jgi:two-component system, sensor histidine kinase and response regulator
MTSFLTSHPKIRNPKLMVSKPLVLVIDDSLVNLAFLGDILEKNHFDIVLANSGERGLAIAKQAHPDIVLLDVVMPGWDGYETCERIKHDPELEKIPVLFLSALGTTENKVRALQAGGVDYISKPFQKEELLARVRTHVELAHLRKNLEREVANKTESIQSLFEALQLAYEKAQQASILKSQFLRNISHEFRTPMNIVLGMIEMLLEETELTEEQRHYAEAAMNAARQLMDILVNMLNFSQQFNSELKQVISDFEIPDMVDNILKGLTVRVKAKNLRLITDIAPQLQHTLRGNNDYINKILSKLIDNAIKFTAQGEVVIRVQELESREDRRWLHFEVSDTGIGIAPEQQQHLFNTFYQVDSSPTRLYQGIGMGLAVAKMFAEQMGGRIGVESALSKGSTFWFNVPLESKWNGQ